MKSYSILVILCLVAFMVCKNQFISGRERPNLRALRPTTRVTTRTTSRHTTKHTYKNTIRVTTRNIMK